MSCRPADDSPDHFLLPPPTLDILEAVEDLRADAQALRPVRQIDGQELLAHAHELGGGPAIHTGRPSRPTLLVDGNDVAVVVARQIDLLMRKGRDVLRPLVRRCMTPVLGAGTKNGNGGPKGGCRKSSTFPQAAKEPGRFGVLMCEWLSLSAITLQRIVELRGARSACLDQQNQYSVAKGVPTLMLAHTQGL